MVTLLHAPEIKRIPARLLDVQPDDLLVERTARPEITRREHCVAAAHDIEGWVEDVLGDRHRQKLQPASCICLVSGTAIASTIPKNNSSNSCATCASIATKSGLLGSLGLISRY